MKLDMITDGLAKLLAENHYNTNTIRFYKREWSKIRLFLTEKYGDTDFEMERGLQYLEHQYGFVDKCKNGTLSQQRVQLLRVVHMLEDYRLHRVLTRRCYASKNPLQLKNFFKPIHDDYVAFLHSTELSETTKHHYTKTSLVFLDYLTQLNVTSIDYISLGNCHAYLKTLAGFSFKTIEQIVCGVRHFLRYLYSDRRITKNLAEEIHMPAMSKQAKIPSAWSVEELRAMLKVIDRNSPIGKRDFAMILLASVLGLRVGDIKRLTFKNINWETKQISFVQHKTRKPLTLPLPNSVGWAIIDYIKNARPQCFETDIVFLKHMPPFDPIGDNNHMTQLVVRYMRKAGINRVRRKHSGFHSLRHSAGSLLLEMETPLPVITEILGHSDPDITAVYLKNDIKKLAECVLSPEGF